MTLDFTKPITTRDGRAVRILCTDGPGQFPVIGIYEGTTTIDRWYAGGSYPNVDPPGECCFDLINPPVKRRGWVIVWRNCLGMTAVNSTLYETLEDAENDRAKDPTSVIVQMPEWEEPS